MAKRFGDLEKRAIAILANGGNPANSNDTELARYWQWKINPSNANHKLPSASVRAAERKLSSRYILPFNVEMVAGVFAEVQISQRTIGATGNLTTALGYQTLTTGQNGYPLRKFKPAQVYWRTGAATTSAPRTSRITGKSYKSYYAQDDQGYVASFGKVGTDSFTDRTRTIKSALGVTINLVTFTAERTSIAV
jgi:hypothetical protein